MSYVRVWIHYIWSTYKREKIILPEWRSVFLNHILENSLKQNLYIDTLNCVDDHIHVLLQLNRMQSISNTAKILKGESSHWWNKNEITKNKLVWQDEYFAISLSQGAIPKLRNYIQNQEKHHKSHSFQEESDYFIKKYQL